MLEEEIQEKLGTRKFKRQRGEYSGCISSACVYECDDTSVFVKYNEQETARLMFDGEMESLKAIDETKTIKVPKPYFAISDHQSSKSAIVMEYIADMRSVSKMQQKLGESLAALHLHNIKLGKKQAKAANWVGRQNDEAIEFISEFGFHCPTCCGSIPMINEWHKDWVSFYARYRLEDKINGIMETSGDRDLRDLWSKLQIIIPNFFTDLEESEIVPSLLHGDLWSGNAGETEEMPVIFDPSSFYGHSEFDLAIARMFGGLGRGFVSSYHGVIKKAPGFDKRAEMYELFHYLNHWQHFGGSYRSQSINIMRRLCK